MAVNDMVKKLITELEKTGSIRVEEFAAAIGAELARLRAENALLKTQQCQAYTYGGKCATVGKLRAENEILRNPALAGGKE